MAKNCVTSSPIFKKNIYSSWKFSFLNIFVFTKQSFTYENNIDDYFHFHY